MALGFAAFAVPDTHITYLQQHPGFVDAYINGANAASEDSSLLPEWWPAQPLEPLGSWGINHRNVDLYHWILNGGPELVAGGGSIFQAWYEPDKHAAIKLDKFNERFAFHADQVSGLASLVAKINVASVRQAFSDWCKNNGDDYVPDAPACEPFVQEFKEFGKGLEEVMRKGYGLVW